METKTEVKEETKTEPSFQVLRGRCVRAGIKALAGSMNLKSKDFEVIDTHKTGGDATNRSYDVWVQTKDAEGHKMRFQISATTDIASGATKVLATKKVAGNANAQTAA